MSRIVLFFLLIANAFGYYVPITNFNTGQVSPLLEARGDFAKYNSASRTLENFLVTVQGPVLKRPGTKYIATAKTGSVRLLPFEYSTDDAYIIETGNLYMRFYRRDDDPESATFGESGQILDSGDPVEIVTTFSTSELFSIQYALTDNEMYLVTGTDAPQILSRTSHTD